MYCICRKPGLSREAFEWAASTADEANFVDPARSAYFLSEERQITP
ncbi:MAG: hypothetical protein ACREM9_00160 [Gemmatimonadales bacterium]